jgi:amino acid adenylation domain-containing protein
MNQPDPKLELPFTFERSIVDRFEDTARRFPDSIAIVETPAKQWTFRDVSNISQLITDHLVDLGIRQGSTVVVYASRCASLVPVIIGGIKAGAAIVILDSAYPTARVCQQIESIPVDAFISVIGSAALPSELTRLFQGKPHLAIAADPNDIYMALNTPKSRGYRCSINADDIAYMLFTSGTTGRPKAVATPHHALPHFIDWYVNTFKPSPQDRFSMLSGLGHDPLFRDIFVPLVIGATIHIPKPDHLKLPRLLLGWLQTQRITFAHLTPSLGRLLARFPSRDGSPLLPALTHVFFGGEPLRTSDALEFQKIAPHTKLVNCYGTSETPQIMACHVVPSDISMTAMDLVPLGRPISDVQVLVVNNDGSLTPQGDIGEIWVRTKYLSSGYIDGPSDGTEKFRANPFVTTADKRDRVYKTGDLGRFTADDVLEFIGRVDNQVKIRGFRVELEEVDHALRQCPLVIDAAVTVDRSDSDTRLYGFVVAKDGFDSKQCRHNLLNSLPPYMVPDDVFCLTTLPLTPNGKIDRASLLRTVLCNTAQASRTAARQTA